MAAIVKLNAVVAARSTAEYSARLFDAHDPPVPIGGTELTSLVLSLSDRMTGEVVNGLDAVDIFNTGRGSIDDGGNLLVTFEPADMAILIVPPQPEGKQYRSMVIEWVYAGGSKVGRHQVDFAVVELERP